MRFFRTSKSSNSNKLVFLGAQAFLCRYSNPCAAFSTVSVGSTSTTAHTNHFPKPIANGGVANSRSPINRSNTCGRSSSKLFSSMEGPTMTNVDKQVGFGFRQQASGATFVTNRYVSIESVTSSMFNILFASIYILFFEMTLCKLANGRNY